MIPTIRNRDEGVRRLMTAMLDLDVHNGWETLHRSRADADPEFRQLYEGYLALLRVALKESLRRWDGTVRAEQEVDGGTYEDALARAHERLWAGPGGDPNVVWVVRLIWLECDLSNGKVAPEARVRPETLLLQWLIDDGEDDLVHLIACMPYWPIGLDANGNWC
jgi:hypothetical protein